MAGKALQEVEIMGRKEQAQAKWKRKRQQEAAKRERRERQAFLRTPMGAAQAAAEAGNEVFQYVEVVTETQAGVIPMVGAYASDEQGHVGMQRALGVKGKVHRSAIEEIEGQGWRMIHAGYVFQLTAGSSRDKFLASGQQEAYGGRVLGIYTFRRAEKQDGDTGS